MGSVANDASSSELFFIDNDNTSQPAGERLSKKALKRNAPLRSEAILLPNSNIAAIGAPPQAIGFKDIQQRAQKKRTVASKETKKLLGRIAKKSAADRPKAAKQDRPANYDVWTSCELSKPVGHKNAAVRNQPMRAQLRRKSAPKPAAAVANLAVDIADPGASYNPDHEQHQDMMGEALAEAYEDRREERRLKPLKYETMSLQQALLDRTRIVDPSDMLEVDEEYDAADALTIIPANAGKVVKRERLTQAKRNKRERAKQAAKRQQKEKDAKEKLKQLDQLQQISKEVEVMSSEQLLRQEKRAAARIVAQTKPLRLGKHKFQEASLVMEVPLTEELKGSLRAARPKGNLLGDRLKSLQKRNVIEPRKRLGKRRRYRLKEYTTQAGKEASAIVAHHGGL